MAGINKVILVGNLGKDPELRHFENESVVAEFPLATSESYKNREGQRVDQTEWHNVVIWRKGLADVAGKYLRKGMMVAIEGKIKTRSWDDKDGNKRYRTEIIADSMTMLGKRQDEDSSYGETSSVQTTADEPATSVTSSVDSGDDLPF